MARLSYAVIGFACGEKLCSQSDVAQHQRVDCNLAEPLAALFDQLARGLRSGQSTKPPSDEHEEA